MLMFKGDLKAYAEELAKMDEKRLEDYRKKRDAYLKSEFCDLIEPVQGEQTIEDMMKWAK